MEKTNIIHEINIIQADKNSRKQITDYIIDEDILDIHINNTKAFQMVFSMTDTKKLAAGFLFTQGIVHEKTDIKRIDVLEQKKQCHIQLNTEASKRLSDFKKGFQIKGSSGGSLLQGTTDKITDSQNTGFTITPDQINTLIQMHWDFSKLFHKTGAVHSAALCDPDKILSYYEDIGRHNAVDKLAGHIFLNEIDTSKNIATVSCRMSLEIIGKIIKTKIPVIISNAAPTLGAVRLADKSGLTIIGFARNNRFNIYTHEERVS